MMDSTKHKVQNEPPDLGQTPPVDAATVGFAEVLLSSDVPAGVVNILTGRRDELVSPLSARMDLNAIFYSRGQTDKKKSETNRRKCRFNR